MATTSKLILWAIPAIPVLLFAGSFVLLPTAKDSVDQGRYEPAVKMATPELNISRPAQPELLPSDSSEPNSRLVIFKEGYGRSRHLKGHLWFAADDAGSHIAGKCQSEHCLQQETNEICAVGTVAQVVDQAWETTWGAAIGWNVAQTLGKDRLFSLSSREVKGLSFQLRNHTGEPAEVRFGVRVDDTDYCVNAKEGKNRIQWSDLKKNCWDSAQATENAQRVAVSAVKWQVVASALKSQFFDVCIAEISELH